MIPLFYQSLWRDEAFSFFLALKSPLEIISLTALDYSPPLYYTLLHYWTTLFGETELSLRSLSLLFHLGSVFVSSLIIHKLTNKWLGALLTSLAVLLNPYLIHYAFETRMYTMLAFLILTSTWFLFNKKHLLSGLFAALAIFTHNYATFYLVSLVLILLLTENQKPKLMGFFKLILLPILALGSWASIVLSQWSRIESSFWLSKPTFISLLGTFHSYIIGHNSYVFGNYLFYTSLATILLAIFSWKFSKIRLPLNKVLMPAALILPVVLSIIVSLTITPIYHDRYLISTLYLAILSIGYVLSTETFTHPLVQSLKTVLITTYLATLIPTSIYTLQTPLSQPIKDSVSFISNQKKGSVAVAENALNFLETKYYFRQYNLDIPVYVFSENGSIPSYIGSVVFDKKDIITTLPDRDYWSINARGGAHYVP